jgi:NAD(P)-dependent dehydrogenase (short-subunit alcohol dehydrogenase family)
LNIKREFLSKVTSLFNSYSKFNGNKKIAKLVIWCWQSLMEMARIFITGSADGLGQLSAKVLLENGHQVVLHARNPERGHEAVKKNPGAEAVVTGDLSSIEETRNVALELNKMGTFDAVIHNAGVYQVSSREIFAANTLAPYILTCMIHRPKRLIYLSSGMHSYGHPKLEYFKTDLNRITYSDSKLHVLMLCMPVARKWPDIYSNAVDPGWVPTKMGGRGAPGRSAKKVMKPRSGWL